MVFLQDEITGQGSLKLDPRLAGLVLDSTREEDVGPSQAVTTLNVITALESEDWRYRNNTNLGTFLILGLHDPQPGQLLLHAINGLKHVLVFNFLQFF